jgi:hypothetical protein
MLTITRIIPYKPRPATPPAPKPKLTKYERVKLQRAKWKAAGLCMQHGADRPCKKCSENTKAWEIRTGKRA